MVSLIAPVFDAGKFYKATTSSDANPVECVMIARGHGWVEVRDSKLEGTPYYEQLALRLRADQFDAYLSEVRNDNVFPSGFLRLALAENGDYLLTAAGTATVLRFTAGEIEAFHDGVRKREFYDVNRAASAVTL